MLVGGGVVAVGAGTEPFSALPEDRDDVDLPAVDELEDQLTAAAVPDGDCEPDGCARWRTEAGSGDTLVVGDRILHHAGTELSVFDAASGDRLARAETQLSAGSVQPQLAGPGEDGQGPGVILGGLAGTEVRDVADGALRWAVEDAQGPMPPVVHDDVVLVADEVADEAPPGWRIRALALADGEERFTVDDAWGGPHAGIVVQREEEDELRLIDAATGEVGLAIEPQEFHGAADGRVGLMIEGELTVLTWPDLEELGRFPDDPQAPVRFVGGLVVDAHPPEEDAPAGEDGLASIEAAPPMDPFGAAPRDVIDPVSGEVLAELDGGQPLGSAPDGDGVLVLDDQGSSVVVSQRDTSWSLQWRTELAFERPEDAVLQIVGAADGQFAVATVVEGEIVQRLPFRARGGVPALPPDLGGEVSDPTVAVAMDDLTMVRSPDVTELRGSAGAVRFGGPADLVHPADPLLVRVDGDLVAVDEDLVRRP